MFDGELIGKELVSIVRSYLENELKGLRADFRAEIEHLRSENKELRAQIADIPAGKDGIDGKDGAIGPQGERGEAGPAGKDGNDGMNGMDGVNGRDGKDADEDAIVQRVLALIPAPKDGERGPQGERGEKGEPGDMGTRGEPGEKGLDGTDGRDGRDGKEGPPGRDALDLEIVEMIEPDRSYPMGTFAKHAGGLVKAIRHTDPIANGDLRAAGWMVAVDGVAGVAAEWIDERTCEIRISRTSGENAVLRKAWPIPLDCGVWRQREYPAGSGVTWAGSFFIAQRDTTPEEKPELSDAWRLAVKRGRDGK